MSRPTWPAHARSSPTAARVPRAHRRSRRRHTLAADARRPRGVGPPLPPGGAVRPDARVRQFQIVWDGSHMEGRVVGPPAVTARVRAEVGAARTAAGAVPPPIEVRIVEALEREPGPAAKLKLIKAQLPSARP